ncbi:hypothetical protein JHK87_000924 [Glycine soja]|nr:hypothetical protein JHK87_000924 [Glycine soja]
MTALELPVSDWEDKWIDVYFDISSKLLDICNAFSSELSRLNQGNLPLKCALHNLDSSASFNELKQLHKELGSSHSHKKHKRHRTENGNDIGKVVGNFVQSVDINKELSLGHVKFDQFKRQQSGSGNSYQDDENFSQQLDVLLDNPVGSLDLPEVKNSAKGKVLMQAMYGVKVETVFICRVFTAAFFGSSKKLSDLNVADIHSWALDFRRLQNLVNEEIRVRFSGGKFTVLNELEAVDASMKILYPTIQAGVDTIEIEWLVKTVEELRAGAEKLSQGNDLLAKGIDGFFEVVMTSGDTLLRSVRIDKTVNDRSPGHNRDMQVVHELCNSLTLVGFGGGGVPL